MKTFDDVPTPRSPLPLDLTPWWMRLFRPKWRFKSHIPWGFEWVYVTAAQYERLFGRKP